HAGAEGGLGRLVDDRVGQVEVARLAGGLEQLDLGAVGADQEGAQVADARVADVDQDVDVAGDVRVGDRQERVERRRLPPEDDVVGDGPVDVGGDVGARRGDQAGGPEEADDVVGRER